MSENETWTMTSAEQQAMIAKSHAEQAASDTFYASLEVAIDDNDDEGSGPFD